MRLVAGVLTLVLLAGCGAAERRPNVAPVSGCGPGGALAFDELPDGPVPTVDDVGRPVIAGGIGLTAAVVGGALVSSGGSLDNGAFYVNTDLGADGWGIRGSWVWPTSTDRQTGFGAVGLLLLGEPYTGTGPTLSESRLHLSIGANGTWGLAVIADATYLDVASGTFRSPALDGRTVYDASALLDPETGDVHLVLPDGSTARVDSEEVSEVTGGRDSRDLGGRYAVVEAYQNLASDVVPEFLDTEAYADPDSRGFRDCLARMTG